MNFNFLIFEMKRVYFSEIVLKAGRSCELVRSLFLFFPFMVFVYRKSYNKVKAPNMWFIEVLCVLLNSC